MTMVVKRGYQMAAGEFKATCLKVMDDVAKLRRPITITKRGKPVVRIVPIADEDEAQNSGAGCLAGEFQILGDIESPILPWTDWEAVR